MKKILYILAALYVFTSTPSKAADIIEITVSPGYTMPIWVNPGSPPEENIGGLSFTVRSYFGSLFFDEYDIEYGVEAGYFPLYSWDYTETFMGSQERYRSRYSVIPVIGQARFRFGLPTDDSFPYFVTGIGFFHWRRSYEYPESLPGAGIIRTSGTETRTTLGFTGGVGYWAQLSHNLHGDLMLRWTSSYSAINFHFGLGMMFF